MSSRYLSNMVLALLGGFLIVTSQAIALSTFSWLMLGVGIATLVITAPAVATGSRGHTQRILDYVFSLLAAWTIIASAVFAGTALMWLGFASGVGLVVLAVAGLTLHELSTERVVHSLELHGSTREHDPELAGMR